ncbi:kinase-like protein, partial [Neocallimastix californiae]
MLGLENKEINQFPTPQDDLFKGEYKILKGKKFSYLINEKNDEIGKGAYGKVFKAKRIKDKIVVAMKKSQIENNSYNLVFPDSTLKEISILFYLKNHKNIVNLYDVVIPNLDKEINSTYMVMEYCETDLEKLIYNQYKSGIPNELIEDLLYQLLCGITYCHTKGIMHCDLKPQNILLKKNDKNMYDLKIADFGISRRIIQPERKHSTEIVTLFYRAPELMLGLEFDFSIDIWSTGCIFAEMALGYTLFKGSYENLYDAFLRIVQIIGIPTENSWPELFQECNNINYLKEKFNDLPKLDPGPLSNINNILSKDGVLLLKKMLTLNPYKRIHSLEALESPYFK